MKLAEYTDRVQSVRLTDVPGKMNKLAMSLQKLKIFKVTYRIPMKAKIWVTGFEKRSSNSPILSMVGLSLIHI